MIQISNQASATVSHLQKVLTTHTLSSVNNFDFFLLHLHLTFFHSSATTDFNLPNAQNNNLYPHNKFPPSIPKSFTMPPKAAADKKPAGASKAPVASKAPEKKDAGKKTASTGEKKKRTKARKETYSSYIYKGKKQPFLEIGTRISICFCKSLRVSFTIHYYSITTPDPCVHTCSHKTLHIPNMTPLSHIKHF